MVLCVALVAQRSEVIDFVINPIPLPMCTMETIFPMAGVLFTSSNMSFFHFASSQSVLC